MFIGKNPWMSQSFPRARVVLNEIAKDPGRSMIVIDPVITDTAKMADIHLRVRPGTDAWCLAALAAVLVQEDLCDEAFLAEHVNGVEPVRDALRDVPVGDYAQRCGVDEELIRTAARRIAGADSVAVFEDLGIQQAPNSTLCSYLNKLLWILTGNFAKRGGAAPAFVVRAAVPAHARRRPHPGDRRTDHRRPDTEQRGAPGDPDRPSRPVPRDDRGEQQSRPLPRRFGGVPGGVRVTGADGGHRRRDDGDRPAGPLCAARGESVREAGGDVLQSGVPAQHISSAASAARAAARARCPSPRSGPG